MSLSTNSLCCHPNSLRRDLKNIGAELIRAANKLNYDMDHNQMLDVIDGVDAALADLHATLMELGVCREVLRGLKHYVHEQYFQKPSPEDYDEEDVDLEGEDDEDDWTDENVEDD